MVEGVSGEGIKRRRREYGEEAKLEDLTAADVVRVRERTQESSDADESGEVSAKELVEQIVKELTEEKENEEEISRKLEEVLEDLEKMEKSNESTEEKLRKALEEFEDQERKEVIDDSSEERDSPKESRFGKISTKEEYDKAVENHSEMKLRASRDEQELTERIPSRIQELDENWVRDTISDLDSNESNRENLTEMLSEISHSLPESERMFYIDINKGFGISSQELDTFEKAFHQAKEGLDENEEVRFGVVGERLYVWKPDLDSTGLENVYDSLYYYFRDKPSFDRYIEDVRDSLGLQDKSQSEILKHLQELAPQMVVEDSNKNCINPQLGRIRGDYVNMMNDISGKMLSDLEGDISKLTKPSGKGGISNPRFPTGEILEISLARLVAVAVSDCHLKPNGTLEYGEPDLNRISIVERDLQVFGDIKLNPKFLMKENLYMSYFPTPLGEMLKRLGIPTGDRSVQNPSIFPELSEFSIQARCAFFEELIPQDGTISGKRIQWTHTTVLDAAHKNKVYEIEPVVGRGEIEFIIKHGKEEKHSWVLNYGVLKELCDIDNENNQHLARGLWSCVYDNPNHLIEGEVEIVGSLGVEYQAKPYTIRYHKRTGRVSVAWTAEPNRLIDSIKLGMIAPPHDVVKRETLKEIIQNHPKYVAEALKHFNEIGIKISYWWKV